MKEEEEKEEKEREGASAFYRNKKNSDIGRKRKEEDNVSQYHDSH